MKYLVRAVKYFFFYIILFVILMAILIFTGIVEADISTMFRNGYDSLWQIAVFFAIIAAAYPKFGYMRKVAIIPGETGEIKAAVTEYMTEHGYSLEKDENEILTFRVRSLFSRIFKMWEDRITFTRNISGYEIEGLRRDIVRYVYGIEYKVRHGEGD